MADIIAGMGHADPAVQEEAVRILSGQGRTVRLDLNDALLAQMCDESKTHGAKVATFDDVKDLLPTTYAYAQARCAQAGTTDAGLQLQALMAWLRPLPPQLPAVDARDLKYLADPQLQAAIRESEQRQWDADGIVPVRVRPVADARVRAVGLQEDLDVLLALQRHRQAVDDLLQRYPSRLDLLRKVALPPPEQADRLMLYQVSLDRQLSKGIGELLQLIALRKSSTQ